jgi:hypothetical protein
MNADSMGPMESRVFPVTLVRWPDAIESRGYCTSAKMTPILVERIVRATEDAIGEPIRHSTRNTFPKPLELAIQDEVALAWQAPSRVLKLSNTLSRANHLSISASRFPRPIGGAYPADWAQFTIRIRAGAPDALKVLEGIRDYAGIAGAFFARADSPAWWDSRDRAKDRLPAVEQARLRIPSEEGWAISERLGWINYFGPRAVDELGFTGSAAELGVEKIEDTADGGRLLWLSKAPFDFDDEAHRHRYLALMDRLEPHRHAGTPIRMGP